MSGGFFRGTSADQDTRFSNKQAKLLKSQKFAPELEHLVDMTKIQMDAIRPWIAKRVTELLGFEDEVLINFIYGLLEGKEVNGKEIHISLTGFMEKNTGKFMKELWERLLSAQKNPSGVPQQDLDAKAEDLRRKNAEDERLVKDIQKKKEKENNESARETERNWDEGYDRKAFDSDVEPSSKHARRKMSSEKADEDGDVEMKNGFRRKRSRSRSVSKALSSSKSHASDRQRSRSVSRSVERRKCSVSAERVHRSLRKRSVTPYSRHSHRSSLSPPRRRSSYRRSRSRSLRRSPLGRRRLSSPFRHRSPSATRRHRSPSPYHRRSPSPNHRRSPSPYHRRSPSPVRHYRSPSPARRSRIRTPPRWRRRRSRDRRSPSLARHCRSPSPVRRRRSPSSSQCFRSPSLNRRRGSPSDRHRRYPSPYQHNKSRPPYKNHISLSPYQRGRLDSPQSSKSFSPSMSFSPVPLAKKSPVAVSPLRRRRSPLASRSNSPFTSPGRRSSLSAQKRYQRSPSSTPRRSVRRISPTSRPRNSVSPVKGRSSASLSRSPQKSPEYRSLSKLEQMSPRQHLPSSAQFRERSPDEDGRELSAKGVQPRTPDQQRSATLQDFLVGGEESLPEPSVDKGSVELNNPQKNNAQGSDEHDEIETASLLVGRVDCKNGSVDSESEENNRHRRKRKRKHKRSERKEASSDDSHDSELDERKEAKRKKKEERRSRKEEKRRRREERRRRREERRAEKLKMKGQDDSDVSDVEHTVRGGSHWKNDEEAELERKKLEFELRQKALESLKAKKGISS